MTPIDEARNLGPKTAEELSSVGIDTLEKLREIGWEECFEMLAET